MRHQALEDKNKKMNHGGTEAQRRKMNNRDRKQEEGNRDEAIGRKYVYSTWDG